MRAAAFIDLDRTLLKGASGPIISRALREAGEPKTKVGHGGTLDPLASGVLPIAIGEATKLAGRMLDSDKIYDFIVAFGVQTDTLDLEGKPIATSDYRPTWAQVEAVLLAKELWDLRHGVMPIISSEMKSAETKTKGKEELAHSISEQINEHMKEIGAQTADRIVVLMDGQAYACGTYEALQRSNDPRIQQFFS